MLTTQVLKSVSHASTYFVSDGNYYVQGEAALAHSAWWGDGAKKMGLTGPISAQQFEKMLAGELPNGDKLGTQRAGQWVHRPGFDLTFSAPKAVSIAALVFGDKQVVEAHKRAVDITLRRIESSCAQCYKKTNGVLGFEETNNLTVATFLHQDSRNNDPNLHTHAVVLNATQRSDEKWVSLSSSLNRYGSDATVDQPNGFIERVRHNKHFYGALYRAQLAFEITQLGYNITKEKWGFSIQGISNSLVSIFSTRRKDIVENIIARGEKLDAKTAAQANLRTRRSKITGSLQDLRLNWLEKANAIEPHCEHNFENAKANANAEMTFSKKEKIDIQKIIVQATKALSFHRGSFSETQLLAAASELSFGKQSIEKIKSFIDSLKDSGELVVSSQEHTHAQLVPRKTLECELRIRRAIDDRCRKPLMTLSQRDAFLLQADELSANEKSALRNLTATPKKIQLLATDRQSEAALLPTWTAMVQSVGFHSVVLSPNEIERDVQSDNIDANIKHEPKNFWEIIKRWRYCHSRDVNTVYGFLRWQEKRLRLGHARPHKMAIFVQRAEEQRPELMDRLIRVADKLGAHLVLSGDPSASNGSLFPALVKQSDTCVHITSKADKSVEPLMHALRVCRLKTTKSNTILSEMAAHYASFDAKTQRQTALWAPSKTVAHALNEAVHLARQAENQLGPAFEQTVLIPSNLPPVKRLLAKHYKSGHWVRFNENYRSMRVKKGEYWRVSHCLSEKNNTVLLSNEKGKTTVWQPNRVGTQEGAIEVFEATTKTFCVNEKVRSLRKSIEHEIRKGDVWEIAQVADTHLFLERDGRTVRLSRQKPIHLDFGYATTFHVAPPRTTHALVYQRSKSKHATQASLHRAVEAVKGDCWVYTESASQYKETLSHQTGLTPRAIDRLLDPTLKIPLAACEKRLEAALAESASWRKNEQGVRAKEAINFAIKHLSEHESAFSPENILLAAMEQVSANVSPNELESVLDKLRSTGHLVGKKKLATAASLSMEKTLLAPIEKLAPLASNNTIESVLKNSDLNSCGQAALRQVLNSDGRINFIEGAPGAGKTTVLKNLQSIVAQEGKSVFCIAPTHRAVQELNARGLPATTVANFLGTPDPPDGEVLILDEASMMPTHQMVALLKKVNDFDKRLIEVGDTKQLPAIEAGKPFSLQKAAHRVTTMDTILRQQASPNLKEAIELTRKGDLAGGFAKLDIREIKSGIEANSNENTRKEADALSLEKRIELTQSIFLEDPKNTFCIVPTHTDKDAVNEKIRTTLIEQGKLGNTSATYTILRAKNSTHAEKSRAINMSVGDIVRINGKFPALHISPGYFSIEKVLDKGRLILKNTQSLETQLLHPKELERDGCCAFDVYRPLKRELRAGDKIIWTRSDRHRELLSSSFAQVEKIENQAAQVVLENGKSLLLDPKDFSWSHFDHGYASTTHALQGGQSKKAVYLIHSYHQTTTQKNWLVGISRAQKTVTIITDDKTRLLRTLEKTTGEKSSALAATGNWPAEKARTAEKRQTVSIAPIQPQKAIIDYEALHNALGQRIATVLQQLMGPPKSKTGTNYVYSYSHLFGGPKGKGQGSLSVAITPDKAGLWQCFKTGEKGNLFSLIQLKCNTDFKGAVEQACRLLGGEIPLKTNDFRAEKTQSLSEKREWSPQEKNKIRLAEKLYKGSQNIQGTLAEHYLREHRHIQLAEWPQDVRFHPAVYSKINRSTHPAMLVVARDSAGKVQSVQATFLDPATKKKASQLPVPKQTFGPLRSASVDVSLQEADSARVLFAEGAETALSLLAASPQFRVKAVLGKSNFSHIDPKEAGQVLLCLDNDGHRTKSDTIIMSALEKIKQQGHVIDCVMPHTAGDDFNDMLKKEGIASIQKLLETSEKGSKQLSDEKAIE